MKYVDLLAHLSIPLLTCIFLLATGNLYLVPAWNCLNQKYLRMLLEMKMEDDISERCVAFSPMLKFWYDSAWVPHIPIGKTNDFVTRRQPGSLSQEVCNVVTKKLLLNFCLKFLVFHCSYGGFYLRKDKHVQRRKIYKELPPFKMNLQNSQNAVYIKFKLRRDQGERNTTSL